MRGIATPQVLDSYHTERHAAGAHVLANTQAQVHLGEAGPGPLVDLLTRVATHPGGNRAFAETITGLDTRYETHPVGTHPWLGRLVPNLALSTSAGDTDVATLLATGRWLLLDLSGKHDLREVAVGWSDRVDIVDATCPDQSELRAILLRPDGHTAWLSTAGPDGLHEALQHWHGPANVAAAV
ncbi:aromatic-ring hydroxylase C-terminal domain-containing protein [Amycolatopsis pigmentata]|uniref:FAD binding domain-containing protein n=1 Tax=Amycolatopsis pigmentata TaxID=450801 RepID=A0ABW5G1Q3_9PSEU